MYVILSLVVKIKALLFGCNSSTGRKLVMFYDNNAQINGLYHNHSGCMIYIALALGSSNVNHTAFVIVE